MDDHLIPITVTSLKTYTTNDIENLYNTIFLTQANPNFFLSIEWISGWLDCASRKPELLSFWQNGSVIGFVFIGCESTKFGKVFYLNQTGHQQDDQIWIEYNDIISVSYHSVCRKALLNYLAKQSNSFQFVAINVIDDHWTGNNWREWSKQAIRGFFTQMEEKDSSQHFSKNTKRQISRSLSFIKNKYGDIQLQRVADSDIEDALDSMAVLHKNQWGTHEYGSGFSNAQFVRFHKQLLQAKLHEKAQVLQFTASDFCLGYMHYFTRNKQVYFYLSAINYTESDNKYKPGLVMHKLAMQHFSALGYTKYDFLAGEARYKTSLSNHDYLLYNLKLYTNKWYYWPIKQVVNCKRYISKKTSQQES